MAWLLDTNAVIAILNGSSPRLVERLRSHAPDEVGLSVIALHELHYGARKSARVEANLALLDRLRFQIIPFETQDAEEAGRIRADLARQGRPIGPYDALIAGQARARGLTLVTANLREFLRVEGLKVEDWTA
jgi:tRNA(fMet)-specific endonuclease VapC